MKHSVLFSILCLFLMGNLFAQQLRLPVSTDDATAKALYYQALDAADDYDMNKFNLMMAQAVDADPDFFAAKAQLAMNNLAMGNKAGFDAFAKQALATDADLNPSEKIMKAMISTLSASTDADMGQVASLGKQLSAAYPNVVEAHLIDGYLQMQAKNTDAALQSFEKVVQLKPDYGPAHNMLGYGNMQAGDMDQAKDHFEKYIASNPDKPNPHDSMGDYYMQTKDYGNAAKHYQKALDLDPDFETSKPKLTKAKQMMDSDSDR